MKMNEDTITNAFNEWVEEMKKSKNHDQPATSYEMIIDSFANGFLKGYAHALKEEDHT